MSDLLTVPEVAARLRVAPMTVYRLVSSGALPALRIGKSIRIDPADLAAYVAAAKQKTEVAP